MNAAATPSASHAVHCGGANGGGAICVSAASVVGRGNQGCGSGGVMRTRADERGTIVGALGAPRIPRKRVPDSSMATVGYVRVAVARLLLETGA